MAGCYLKRSRHGTVFYFRRRVPRRLLGLFNRSHIVVSLRLADREGAIRAARQLAAATDRLFDSLRPMSKPPKDPLIQTNYEFGLDLDPKTGRLSALFRDVKPEDQPDRVQR